jgi:hypothetical protein
MVIREATLVDIHALVEVRASVKENVLTSHIPIERIAAGLETRGKGWVAEHEGRVVGFSMADREESMIWGCSSCPSGRGMGLAEGCSLKP